MLFIVDTKQANSFIVIHWNIVKINNSMIVLAILSQTKTLCVCKTEPYINSPQSNKYCTQVLWIKIIIYNVSFQRFSTSVHVTLNLHRQFRWRIKTYKVQNQLSYRFSGLKSAQARPNNGDYGN